MTNAADTSATDSLLPEHYNRPGLPAIAYRAGTHPTFLRRMFDRLLTQTLEAGSRPLARLKTREPDDPAIALLDAWAIAADVLTFYQERIANEGYLRTATEQRSVLELARAIGYEFHPGVAAGAFLAFTVEEPEALKTTRTVTVPQGTKVQSIPGQGQRPQTFETSAEIVARHAWNALRPRLTQPQALNTKELYLAGVNTHLKAGDLLLLVYQPNSKQNTQPVRIQRVVAERERGHTRVELAEALQLSASVSPDTVSVFAFRARFGFFGHNAPNYTSLPTTLKSTPYSHAWDPGGWEIWKDSTTNDYYAEADVYLEGSVPEVVSESWVVFDSAATEPKAYEVSAVTETSLTGFSLSCKTTGLQLKDVATSGKDAKLLVRKTTAYLQSEPLALAEMPIEEPLQEVLIKEEKQETIGAKSLTLNRQVENLQPGQLLALSGELADVPGQIVHEVVTLDDSSDNGDFTTLYFRDRLHYRYLRRTVTLNANVARATHGETAREVLGSGDGSQTNQRFTLKRRPLTYVSAPTPSGVQSTIEVRVNDVRWEEAASLHGLTSENKSYQVRVEADGATRVTFGDGQSGARLASGVENIVATYRTGIGPEGEVDAHALTLLQTRPLGIRSVTNPLPASGAAPLDDLEAARVKAPLNALTIDRLVSLADYEHFARAFAGISQAQAVSLWNGQTRLVHLTLAGVGGEKVEAENDLYLNLLNAIQAFHDPLQPVLVNSYTPRHFNVSGKILVEAHYRAEAVLNAVQAALLQTFSFEQRSLGQPVTASEVIAVMQRVPGVIAVDLDWLHSSDQPSALLPFLSAGLATWDAGKKTSVAAELLMVNPNGITLFEMK
jgi:predicted phage baseplate assembly protein